MAWGTTYFFLIVFNCKPIRYFWDKSIPGGKCYGDTLLESYLLGAANIVTDIAVLVLPIPWLAKLQMDTSKKLALIGTFLLGSLWVSMFPNPVSYRKYADLTGHSVCIASVLRMPFIGELNNWDVTCKPIHHISLNQSWPSLDTIVNLGIWINVECCVGILCACIPTLRPLVRTRWPEAFRSRFSRSRSSRSGTNRGSLRLTDEKNSRISTKTKTLVSTAEGPNTKEVSGGKHKSWFGTQNTKDDERTRKGSMEEEMVPMGNIAVRHDVEWINADSNPSLADKGTIAWTINQENILARCIYVIVVQYPNSRSLLRSIHVLWSGAAERQKGRKADHFLCVCMRNWKYQQPQSQGIVST